MIRSIEFILLDLDYEMNKEDGIQIPLLRLWGRSAERTVEVRILDFFPYFYVEATIEQVKSILKKNNLITSNWILKLEKCIKRQYFGGVQKNLIKVVGRVPYLVPKIRNLFLQSGIPIYEADIPFTKRLLIDRGLKALHTIKASGTILRETKEDIIVLASINDISQLNISSNYQPLVMAFDIEVAEEGETITELFAAKNRRVTAISLAWGYIGTADIQTYVIILEADSDLEELKLLTTFQQKILKIRPDVIVSFNGTNFDIPYLKARFQKYNLNFGKLAIFDDLQADILKSNIPVDSYRLKGRALVDLLPKTWGIHPISGKKTLNSIAKHVLGESKVETDMRLGELWREAIKGDKEKYQVFYNYSLTDSLLTFRLTSELGIADLIELCRLSGYPLPEGLLSTHRNIGELELMRILYTRNMLIPNVPDSSELKIRTELKKKHPHLGGWVLDPEVDEALCVAIFDFLSLYPNIVRQHNISGETLIPNSEKLSPIERFKQLPRYGALAELMDRVLKTRYQLINNINLLKNNKTKFNQKEIQLQQKQQRSLKLMANSVIGAANYPRGRFYHYLISNSITAIARTLLRDQLQYWTAEFSVNHPYQVYVRYGDTDSIFVEFEDDNLDLSSLFRENTNREEFIQLLDSEIKDYQTFLSSRLPEFLELKREDIALRIILKKGRKKAYAYLSLLTNKVVIRGFEAVRSDWSPLARKTQRLLLETLLRDFSDQRLLNARRLILKVCFKILNDPQERLIPELTILGPVKRSPKSYRSVTQATGAFLHYCEINKLDPEEEYKKWDGFPYIITEHSENVPQYQRAFHPDFIQKNKEKIDRNHYIREILGASNRFGIDISEAEVKSNALIIPLTNFL